MPNITPNYPDKIVNRTDYVKPASVDIMIDSAEVPIELMTDLIFEAIGGQELINLSRSDALNGQTLRYHPIANIKDVALRFNSLTMLPSGTTSKDIFERYIIRLESRIPSVDDASPVEISETDGSIVLNFINLRDDERVQIQILSEADLFDDTIY